MNTRRHSFLLRKTYFHLDQTWKQVGTTVVGGRKQVTGSIRLDYPNGMCIDDGQTIFIADTDNHRIVEKKKYAKNSQIIAGGNGEGNRNDQLNRPSNVFVDQQNASLIICDWKNRRVMRWSRYNSQTGEVLIPNIDCWDLTIDKDRYLYVSDSGKYEVRRWEIGDEVGTIVAGGNGQGNELRQLSSPHGIIVEQFGTLYVADTENHRVMRWLKGAEEGTIVTGGNREGAQPNRLSKPVNLSFDRENNLYVVDCWNNRVQRFKVN